MSTQMHCRKCATDKPSAEFYASSKACCKVCVRLRVTAHRAVNLLSIQAYDRGRNSRPERVEARAIHRTTSAYRVSHRAACDRWEAKNYDRKNAQTAVGNAVRDGKIFKQPCHCCGADKVEAHHPDYSRPLDVVWLCVPHHAQLHKEFVDTQREELLALGAIKLANEKTSCEDTNIKF